MDNSLSRSIHMDKPSTTICRDRAWGVAIGAGLAIAVGLGPIALFTFGVFLLPILQDTGWSREIVAGAIGPALLLTALGQPLAGMLADRFGARRVILLSSFVFGASVALVGLLPQDPVSFSVLFGLMFFISSCSTLPPAVRVVSGWFDARRGLALSVVFAFASVGIAVLPPLAASLIGSFGWRQAYVILGCIAWVIIFPSAIFLLRDAPQIARGGNNSSQAAEGLTVRETLRTGRFWVIFVAFLLLTGGVTAGVVNFPVILAERGIAPQQAAFIMTVIGAANFLGRVAMGMSLDRWFSPWVTAVACIFPVVAYLLMMIDGNGTALLVVAAALLGFGLGCESDALAYIASRAFGLRFIGAIYGLINMAYGFGVAAGPALFGVFTYRLGSYTLAYLAAAVSVSIGALLLLTLRQRNLPFVQEV